MKAVPQTGRRASPTAVPRPLSRGTAAAMTSFGLDLRSLALFRIGVAILLIVDLILRSANLTAHYTHAGVLPPEAQQAVHGGMQYLSLHYYAGASWFTQALLFFVQGIIAVGLLLGWRTWLMTLLSWLLLLSLHRLNDFILDSGDTTTRVLLFWSMFLPLGARWSLDSRAAPAAPAANTVLSLGSVAFILQLCFVYWFTALMKTEPVWWNGRAIHFALNNDSLLQPFGAWLRQYPGALSALSWSTLALEFLGPLLVILPLGRGWLRVPAILAFIAFHIGIGLCMDVGLFTYICPLAWLALLPTVFWDRVLPASSAPAAAPAAAPSPAAQPGQLPRAANIFAAVALTYVVLVNVAQLNYDRLKWLTAPLFDLAQSAAIFGSTLGLDQRWSMFAPEPRRVTTWYELDGRLADRSHVNPLLNGEPITTEKPDPVIASFGGMRWLRYLINLDTKEENRKRLNYLAQYLVRDWNAQHGESEQMTQLTISVMVENVREDGREPARKYLLLDYRPPAKQ